MQFVVKSFLRNKEENIEKMNLSTSQDLFQLVYKVLEGSIIKIS